MSENNNNNGDNNQGNSGAEQKPEVTPEVQALIDAALAKQLDETKKNLDKAYSARDEAKAEADRVKAALREAEVKQLEKEGKAAEALQLQLEDERKRREAAEAANTTLSRDNAVRQSLQDQSLVFMNGSALEMAFSRIVSSLVRNDKGEWVTLSGASITDAVKVFAADENNTFLFKAKANSGAGTNNNQSNGSPAPNKSVFSMTQAEVIKLAAEGKLGNGGAQF